MAVPSSNYDLRLPFGPGGCRFYDLNPGAGLNAILPDARICRTGGPVLRIYNRSSSNSLTINANDGTTSVATLAAGALIDLWLLDNSTANGGWMSDQTSSSGIAESSAIPLNREVFEFSVSGQHFGFNLAEHLRVLYSYVPTVPAIVTMTVMPNTVLGGVRNATAASNSHVPGFTAEGLPASSHLRLILRPGGYIVGVGGHGASGVASAASPLVARPGGDALLCAINTSLINDGVIGGGGGGGGAGLGAAGVSGGGGGGGAGSPPGLGGSAGTGGMAGVSGQTTWRGSGGSGNNTGGSGGYLGDAGSQGEGGGSAGGAAGNATLVRTSAGYSLTKIRAGIIHGTEATF